MDPKLADQIAQLLIITTICALLIIEKLRSKRD